MEKNSNKDKELFLATFLLKLSGGDKVPTKVKDHIFKDLGLSTSDSLLGFTINKLDEEEDERKLDFIKGLMVSQLRPSQLMGLHSFIRDIITGSMESMAEHPEQRDEVSVEKLLKDMHNIL